jgi:hypothetical protein
VAHPKLIFVDAAELLWKFMGNDVPNESVFKKVVGEMVAQARLNGPVRIFGEMVAILWLEGRAQAALRLEALWNTLIAEQSFALLCGYPKSLFSGNTDALRAISQLHTHVHSDASPSPG